MTGTLTPNATVNEAAAIIGRTQRWLRTDQAAIMRQLPESQSAFKWWFDQGREHADSVVTVPAWIEHYYGTPVVADRDHRTLSATAAAVAGLLTDLATRLRDAPLYLVNDPHVRMALVTLAMTSTYRTPTDAWPTAVESGTVLFGDMVPFRQHTAPDFAVPGLSEGVDRDSEPTLGAVTWYRDSDLVRCVDWVGTTLDKVGVGQVDDGITDTLTSTLPPLLNNGHWKLPTGRRSGELDARARLMAAHTEVMRGQAARWDGESTVEDADTLLAARVATVIADALAGGLFVITERRITGAERHQPRRVRRERHRRHVVFTVDPKPSRT